MNLFRRGILKALGLGALGAAVRPTPFAVAQSMMATSSNEFFLFIHARGGWDVTLSLDPRNARTRQGNVEFVEPASTDSVETGGVIQWRDAAPVDGLTSFAMVQPPGCNIRFGPSIGLMAEARRFERMAVINGIAMNTVSHSDGAAYSSTGRHLAGTTAVSSSVDAVVASAFGTGQLFPVMSIGFPSYFIPPRLDARAIPIQLSSVAVLERVLNRSNAWTDPATRTAVNQALALEARELSDRSYFTDQHDAYALQFRALESMLADVRLRALFSLPTLRADPRYARLFTPLLPGTATPIPTPWRFESNTVDSAAFAIESFRLNVARCISLSTNTFDDHGADFEDHPRHQQELFNLLAGVIDTLSLVDHPTLSGSKLIDHTHIIVLSEFCRTPQININAGRDHYPNNSMVVVSPKFRGNRVFGSTDEVQLLPQRQRIMQGGVPVDRVLSPADLLATFLSAFDVDRALFPRDGVVVSELLRP